MALSAGERDRIEREMATDILQRHRKRTSHGMMGGLLTAVHSCCWCGTTWRCIHMEWAGEILQAQAAIADGESSSEGGSARGAVA